MGAAGRHQASSRVSRRATMNGRSPRMTYQVRPVRSSSAVADDGLLADGGAVDHVARRVTRTRRTRSVPPAPASGRSRSPAAGSMPPAGSARSCRCSWPRWSGSSAPRRRTSRPPELDRRRTPPTRSRPRTGFRRAGRSPPARSRRRRWSAPGRPGRPAPPADPRSGTYSPKGTRRTLSYRLVTSPSGVTTTWALVTRPGWSTTSSVMPTTIGTPNRSASAVMATS